MTPDPHIVFDPGKASLAMLGKLMQATVVA